VRASRPGLVVLALAAALAAAAPAAAHVTVVPPFAAAGSEARLVLDVPNERRMQPMTSLVVSLPPGMEARAAEPQAGFRATVDGRHVRWTGGSLAPRATGRFALVAVAPRRAGAVSLDAVQGYPDGGSVPWDVPLTITPADTGGADQNLGAAIVTAAVGLAVIVGSLVVLHRLRRRRVPLQDR
jgi:hypothetical protein